MDKLIWLKLKSVAGIGNYSIKNLIAVFKTPKAVFEADYKNLIKVQGISEEKAKNILKHKTPDSVKKDYETALDKNYQIITMSDKEYPHLLLKISDPPPFLYVLGKLNNKADNIAIVGSRVATNYGLIVAKRISGDIANLDIQVVSGMARGIDTAAHIGAISSGGKTIAVLGSGFEKIYPLENKKLFYEIQENGAVISEFSPFKEPKPENFPMRNRIISGISLGTLVVEASKKSGSLITARLALEQGREVFAVPGNINSFKSAGTHHLLKQGAKLVENANDIIDEVRFLLREQDVEQKNEDDEKKTLLGIAEKLEKDELKVFNSLSSYDEHIDKISEKLNINIATLSGILTKLELKGLVSQSSGKMFAKI